MRQRKRHFLHRGRSGFADVIAADRDCVPVGQLARAVGKDVGHDSERGARWIYIRSARDVLLQDVVLNRACERSRPDALPPRHGDVQREQDDGRRVDRHRRRDAIERNSVEQDGHVLDRIDRDADLAHLALSEWMVGVVAHLRRQIEGDAQAVDALGEEIPVPGVGFSGRREAGVLPHRPQAATVHRRLNAAREREFAGKSELAHRGTLAL